MPKANLKIITIKNKSHTMDIINDYLTIYIQL